MRWTGSALALLCAQLAVAAAFQGSTVQQWRTCGGVHALRCAAENRKERTEAGCTGQFVDAVIPKPMGLVLEENHPSIQGCKILKVMQGSNAEAYQNSRGDAAQPLKGAQLVSVNGQEVLGMTIDQVMDVITKADAPVKLRLYQGAASSLYGGWEQEARGKEVFPTRLSSTVCAVVCEVEEDDDEGILRDQTPDCLHR